ncbi:hypothetical protein LMG27177_07431 [Paraburkholderia fynbosensis]|uniref:Uncharacterized protein n=1 Tax=Paraburkholderia fynbosensis TaxID=1200993 RepID=A0A6J5H1F7_9BURK|nr:hypothetical protein LMG27177_07431 [Paraburkholderia fynbosensis]
MSLIVVALQPSRNITLAVEHAPNFHMSLTLNIEDQLRIAIKQPRPQAWDIQLVRVTGRPDVPVLGETLVCRSISVMNPNAACSEPSSTS